MASGQPDLYHSSPAGPQVQLRVTSAPAENQPGASFVLWLIRVCRAPTLISQRSVSPDSALLETKPVKLHNWPFFFFCRWLD